MIAPLLWASLALKLILAAPPLECCGAFPPHRWTLTATCAVVLWLSLPTLWLRRRGRLLAGAGFNLAASILIVADRVHGRFFGDPTSISELIDAWQLPSVSKSILASLQPSDALFFIDIPVFLALTFLAQRYLSSGGGATVPRWAQWTAAVLAAALTIPAATLAVRDPDGVFEFAIGRRQVVAAVGLGGYHAFDIVAHLRYRTFGRWTISETDIKRAETALRGRVEGDNPSAPPWASAEGANLIIVQAESLQAFPIDAEIDGRPVMPNLRALARESMSASNFFDQTAAGGTSDAAFTVLQSLHPIDVGAVATRYPTNRYYGLPAILKARGYDTLAMMGASDEFWNMRQLLTSIGFSDLCLNCAALQGLRFGQGLADGDFFSHVIPTLRTRHEPFFAFLITVSNHHPYEVPRELNPMSVGSLEGTLLGRYLQSVHYFDESLGEFLRTLTESGLLDRSVLVVYGDHHGYLGTPPELRRLTRLSSSQPIRLWEANRRLPFLIRSPRTGMAGPQLRPVGHLDVAPTVLKLLGIDPKDDVMLGRGLFDGRMPFVVFRDAGFVSSDSYLLTQSDANADPDNGRAAAGCYDAAAGRQIDCARLERLRETATDELKLSDLILRGDLIPTLRDRLRRSR